MRKIAVQESGNCNTSTNLKYVYSKLGLSARFLADWHALSFTGHSIEVAACPLRLPNIIREYYFMNS